MSLKTFARLFPLFNYFILCRPATLLAPLLGGIFISLCAIQFYGIEGYSALTIVYIAGTLVFLNIGSNIVNQIADLSIDRINKPKRPLCTGKIGEEEAWFVAILAYIFALARAFTLDPTFGLLVVGIVLFTLAYSLRPLRLKRRLWWSAVCQAVPRGYLGFLAVWVVWGSLTNPVPHILGVFITLFLIGGANIKDYADVEGDASNGIHTLPVVYGPRRTGLYITPFLILPFLWLAGWASFGIISVACFPLFLLGIISVKLADSLLRRGKHNIVKGLENTEPWVLMYLWLSGAFVIMGVMYSM